MVIVEQKNMSFFNGEGFSIDGRHFVIMLASDVRDRDGLGWQLLEIVSNKSKLVLEIFRHDDLKSIEFIACSPVKVPFEALEKLINHFNTNGGREFIND